ARAAGLRGPRRSAGQAAAAPSGIGPEGAGPTDRGPAGGEEDRRIVQGRAIRAQPGLSHTAHRARDAGATAAA
ncbi:MAG: hypothetical protein KGL50_00720, partial [Burkholderiales bacterium]|nr:hypothetical protein [Burkholderiales bacterium]